jgi:transposase
VETDATRMCELLVGFVDVDVLSVDDTSGGFVEVTVRTRSGRAFCHGCGVLAGLKEWQPTQLVDLACFGRPARLCWRKRRWRCNQAECPVGSWTEVDNMIASPRQRLTRRAGMWACRQVGEHSRTVAEIAGELGADWHTINDTVVAWGEALLDADVGRIGTPEAIGIDETLAVRRGPFRTQEWLTGIVDVRPGRLLDVVEGRTSAGPIEWFTNQGPVWCSYVKWAALDLSGPYRRVYDIALPNAIQVADPFHVVKLANLKLDLVRQRVQTEQLGHRGRKHDPLYRARKLLQIAGERLPEDRQERLRGLLFAGDPDGEVRTCRASRWLRMWVGVGVIGGEDVGWGFSGWWGWGVCATSI